MYRMISVGFMVFIFLLSCGAQKSSWKSPSYKKDTYRKVLVLAKTTNDLAKRQLEDATVDQLVGKGIAAIPAYSNIKEADTETEEKFLAKANSLGVDALLVYNFGKVKSEYKNSPSVNARVGVPIRMGIFRGFLGTNVPLAGGAKKIETVEGTAAFYTRDNSAIQWSQSLRGNLKNGTGNLASDFAVKTVDRMIEDQLF